MDIEKTSKKSVDEVIKKVLAEEDIKPFDDSELDQAMKLEFDLGNSEYEVSTANHRDIVQKWQ